MKFGPGIREASDLLWTNGAYAVYHHVSLGRYFLVKDSQQLAWKNYATKEPDFSRWVTGWEKNAKKQINSLADRIDDLKAQQDEFRRLLK